MKISIITINWWTKDFAEKLHKSIVKNTENDFEILIVDNSNDLNNVVAEKAKIIRTSENLGHGTGLNLGIEMAMGEYILIIDSDAHLLLKDWNLKLIAEFEKKADLKMACATDGELLKPAKPLFMFFKRETIINNNISFRAREFDGVKFDVGIHAYFKILSLFGNKSILQLPYEKTKYIDVLGNEHLLNGERLVYHNWYGSRFYENDGSVKVGQIDGLTYEDFINKKNNLFKQIEK